VNKQLENLLEEYLKSKNIRFKRIIDVDVMYDMLTIWYRDPFDKATYHDLVVIDGFLTFLATGGKVREP
jgi:hypothetical protein